MFFEAGLISFLVSRRSLDASEDHKMSKMMKLSNRHHNTWLMVIMSQMSNVLPKCQMEKHVPHLKNVFKSRFDLISGFLSVFGCV